MQAAYITISIIIVIASILLTLVVLVQNSKGGGLAANFAAGNQTFGVRQTADLLEKVTWGLVAFILVVSIVTSFTLRNSGAGTLDITNDIENVQEQQQPSFPTAPIEQGAPEAAPAE